MLGLPASGLREVRALVERYGLHAEPFLMVPMRQVARDEGWYLKHWEQMGKLYGVGVIADVRLMVINAAVSPEWQRFAMAHELAHDLLGHRGWFTCTEGSLGRELERAVLVREEVEANVAAALILVPPAALSLATMAEVAEVCGVPLDVVELRRACALGLRERTWATLVA